jgi:hypothetical protein
MTDTYPTIRSDYYPKVVETSEYDDDLAPYASLFLKPFARKKCEFSKSELEVMCRDPLHSPRLILYLIDFFKRM